MTPALNPHTRAAALHAIGGLVKDQDIPVGQHDLEGVEVVFGFVAGCAVIRDPGSDAKGFDDITPELKQLPAGTELLILARTTLKPPTKADWKRAILDAMKLGKLPAPVPELATLALAEINAAIAADPATAIKRKTAARRVGLTSASIDVRIPGTHQRDSTLAMANKRKRSHAC